MSGPERPRDTALLDTATVAADDFYCHVNGGLIQADPVPRQHGSWGAGQIAHTRSQEILHRLLTAARRLSRDRLCLRATRTCPRHPPRA
jgi:predicted metalloendopeptidase